MKVKVKATFGEQERIFEICCGTGEQKTFKWLGNAVSQRFALSAPNGGLRHRDHFRGVTESAQHTCAEIRFKDGQMPHPTAIIADFLHDGDEVNATLVVALPIEDVTGNTKMKKWALEAYASTGPRISDDILSTDDGSMTSEEAVIVRSKAQFMRLILGSQMINTSQVANDVASRWSIVNTAMPRLHAEYNVAFRQLFEARWQTIKEVFQHFAPDGAMTAANFKAFLDEVQIFSPKDATALSNHIYRRTCQSTQSSSNGFAVYSFIVAIILCAQLRHNDTFEFQSTATDAVVSIVEILDKNIVAFAEKMNFFSVIKLVFCSDEVLYGIRMVHEELFQVFEKFAQKSHTLPTSLKVDHLAECLGLAGLDGNKDRARAVFELSRHGVIYGRGRVNPMLEAQKFQDEPIPSDELIYPEFVECAARAGVIKFYRTPLGAKENGDAMTLAECMLRGVRLVLGTLVTQERVGKEGRK